MASKLVSSLKPFHCNMLRNVALRLQSTAAVAVNPLFSTPETLVSTTSNGVQVASQVTADSSDVCAVGVTIASGSRYETHANNGISHFVEHMIFKGTQNRSQSQLETQLENMGAQVSAHTGREQIAYTVKCLKKDLPAVVDILSDVVQNPLFDEETIEKERSVILQEIDASDADQEVAAFNYLHTAAFLGTSLSFPVLGSTENATSITKSDLHDYVNANFTGHRIVLAAAGGVDHEALAKLADGLFSGLPAGDTKVDIEAGRFTGTSVTDRNDDLPTPHMVLAVQGCTATSQHFLPLEIAKTIIGSWSKGMAGAGAVFGKLPEGANQWMQSYKAFNICYEDTGLFGAHLTSDPMQIEESMYLMQTEWMRLCTMIGGREIERAKIALKTNLCLQLGNATGVCENIGKHMLHHGRHLPLSELCEQIDAVTEEQVKFVCTKYIYDKCPAVAGVGPIEGYSDYNAVRARMYWLRF